MKVEDRLMMEEAEVEDREDSDFCMVSLLHVPYLMNEFFSSDFFCMTCVEL